MVKTMKGNLLESGKNVLVHQVNCQGVMGAGIASQIRVKYPHVYLEYKEFCEEYSKEEKETMLGGVLFVKGDTDTYIANVFSQLHFGSGLQTDYHAMEEGLQRVFEFIEEQQLTVGIPHLIGCGLAGGDWEIVKEKIDRIFPGDTATLYEYTPKKYR